MNEGIAKALRRQARAAGQQTTAPGRGTVVPGRETKALWSSLSHKQRGQWRGKLPATRAALRRSVRKTFAKMLRSNSSMLNQFWRGYAGQGDGMLSTGRTSYANVRSQPPRSS